MRILMIAALVAAPLAAAAGPAQAAERVREQAANEPVDLRPASMKRVNPGDVQAPALLASAAQQPDDGAEKPRKKRKSTGDKVLTGAAVVLGLGALAVGGLLVAIFVG